MGNKFSFNAMLGVLLCFLGFNTWAQQHKFTQTISTKYPFVSPQEIPKAKKVVVDYDDNVYVLSDQGMFWAFGDRLLPDVRYSSLAGKIPVDITLQEETGYIYYLYADRFVTNSQAGRPQGKVPAGKYSRFAVNAAGQVLLAGGNQVAMMKDGKDTSLGRLPAEIKNIFVHKGLFYVQSGDRVYMVAGEKELEQVLEFPGLKAVTFRDDEIIAGGAQGYSVFGLHDGRQLVPMQQRLPVLNITSLAIANGQVWAGTDQGAFRRQADGSFRYYGSQRWLMDNEVIDLAFDSKGHAYVLSLGGLNKIAFEEKTLAEKAAHFEAKIRERHMRFGFSTETRVTDPSNLGMSVLTDDDNDGLWTSFYLGSMAFKYATTGDERAGRYAWESFQAFERLLSVNQLDGFPSRTFERTGFKVSGPSKWRDSPDEGWEWKGHTSSDEFVGYIFVAAVMDQFVAKTELEKKRVADFIDAILEHMIRNDYYFVDIDGKPTLWGRWHPEYINFYPETVVDRKLGSTTLIAGLQLGYALTGKERFRSEAYRLMKEHGYFENIMIDLNRIAPTPGVIYDGHNMGDGGWNHSDDEMAFLTYWVLYHYAFDEELRSQWEWVIRNHWEIELPERNALWSLITHGSEGSIDKESVFWHLEGFAWDLVRHTVKNTHRKDLNFLEANFRGQTTDELLHPDERSVDRHNANPFDLDAGRGGRAELTGDEFLLPYWMGRYLGVFP